MASAPILSRPGILKAPSVLLGAPNNSGDFGPSSPLVPPPPDVAGGVSAGVPAGVCAVPNCSANCGRPGPPSILKQTSQHHQVNGSTAETHTMGAEAMGFNSSCQQCIAERASLGVNTLSK